jgi:hypothetical protein
MPEDISTPKQQAKDERLAAARGAAAKRRELRMAQGASPDDFETDAEAEARAKALSRSHGAPGATGPEPARSVGPKQHGPEFSDPLDPSRKQNSYYKGDMSPEMAGERSKTDRVVNDIKDFINKYSKFAIDHFYGAEKDTVKQMSGPESTAIQQDRFGGRGGVHGISQLMDKDKALKLADDLPMMPQDQVFSAARTLANYIWKIHGNARKGVRRETAKKMIDQGQLPLRKKEWQGRFVVNPTTGEPETEPGKYDFDDQAFKDAYAVATKEFDNDSAKVKGALNLLASATGTLQRAKGKGGKADATYLTKVPKYMKPPEIVAKQPMTAMTPRMRSMAGPTPAEPEQHPKQQKINPRTGKPIGYIAKPVGPIIRRKQHEAFNRWINEMIERADADHTPTWWEELY